jgi:hypothetical protein
MAGNIIALKNCGQDRPRDSNNPMLQTAFIAWQLSARKRLPLAIALLIGVLDGVDTPQIRDVFRRQEMFLSALDQKTLVPDVRA